MISPIRTARVLRQHPIVYEEINHRKYFYVADFYCASYKTVIELDGKMHEFKEQQFYDKARDRMMIEMGLRILRIQNDELRKMSEVLDKIEQFLIH
jgi:very-short-patch-repair endonuclease